MKKNILFCICLSLLLSGCASVSDVSSDSTSSNTQVSTTSDDEPVSRDIFAMDTYMTITAYGSQADDAVDASVEEIERLDSLLSTGDSQSEVYKINENGGGTLSEDGAYLMTRALDLYRLTDGVFNIAIYPVMDAWGFTSENYRVPEAEELSSLLELADPSLISFDESTGQVAFSKDGMAIDFGGIAKGYTSTKIMDIFDDYGLTSGLVSLGGNVQLHGTKPDGSPFKVAIQSPYDSSSYLGVLEASDTAVITSGGYERYFEEDGKTYHHIIDPSTGYPAESGLISVTIVSPDGTLADGLSTSLFIMGLDNAISFYKNSNEDFDFILMTDEDTLYVTEGIASSFTSDYQINIVNK